MDQVNYFQLIVETRVNQSISFQFINVKHFVKPIKNTHVNLQFFHGYNRNNCSILIILLHLQTYWLD